MFIMKKFVPSISTLSLSLSLSLILFLSIFRKQRTHTQLSGDVLTHLKLSFCGLLPCLCFGVNLFLFLLFFLFCQFLIQGYLYKIPDKYLT